ncbi:protein ANTAGONIST OF LIKE HETEROCHROMATIN PROTEIN 1-like, partial [Astyanax mexicanus]
IRLNEYVSLFLYYRKIWIHPRSMAWWEHINNVWTDKEWLFFRMRRGTFMHLCDLLRPYLIRQNTKYRRPVEIRVSVCLWRLATNLEYRSISHLFGVGLSTCCIITQQVVTVINVTMKSRYIKTPSTAELRAIVQGFRAKCGFTQVAGAIDDTHINIKAPSNAPADYYNRKGQYSVILQGVVHNNMKFWDINFGQPGKVHDAHIILGDTAYPLLPWLMKPFPEFRGATAAQLNFNHRLSQARMTVGRSFGRLKGRWRCLLKQNESHITLVSRIISACCVLHNFCEVNDVGDLDNDENPDQVGEKGVKRSGMHCVPTFQGY